MRFFSLDQNGWVITIFLFQSSSFVPAAREKNLVLKSMSVDMLMQFFLFLVHSSFRCGQIESVQLAS